MEIEREDPQQLMTSKRASLGAALVLCLLAAVGCQRAGKGPTEPSGAAARLPWLRTEGARIVNEEGSQVVLRGVNRSGLEYDRVRGNGISEEEIDYICRVWCARIVRIPFNQEWVLNDPSYVERLDQVVRWIKKNGAYVILDLQWQNTTVKIPSIPDSNAIRMWRMLAQRYRDEPAVLYDIHNETHDIDFASWRRRAIEIIEAIQSVHPRALILVSGMNWASDMRPWAQNPLPHANVVYSVHMYPWVGGPSVWESNFGQFADRFPIFCGELGGGDQDVDWGRELIRYLNAKQIGWCAWSWVDQPYLTLPEDRRTPTPFGQLVFTYLRRYAQLDSSRNRIFDLRIGPVTTTTATITWRTDWEADSRVLYGTATGYTDSVVALALLKSHLVKLSGLRPATLYHFRAASVDEFGLRAESRDTTFQTSGSNL